MRVVLFMVRKTKTVKTNKFEPFKYPYEKFPFCLQHYEGDDLRTCWFECEEHFQKYVARYKLNEDEIKFKHKDGLEMVVQSTGGESKRVRQRIRQNRSN